MAEIELRLHCTDLPPERLGDILHLRLGIQRDREVVDDVPVSAGPVVFFVPIRVTYREGEESPRFSGEFVHGKTADRFLYLCWGERDGEAWLPNRRAKVLLGQMPRAVLQHALSSGTPVEVTIRATGRRGEPVAASLKPPNIEWPGQ